MNASSGPGSQLMVVVPRKESSTRRTPAACGCITVGCAGIRTLTYISKLSGVSCWTVKT